MTEAPMGDSVHNPAAMSAPGSQQTPPNEYAPYSVGNPSSGTYVGVPDDYKVLTGYAQNPDYQPYMGPGYGMGGSSMAQQNPVYRVPQYTYDELGAMRGQSPQRIFEVQRLLYNTGYLASGFRTGWYDKSTEEALADAMADANRQGLTLDQLAARISAGQKGLKGTGYGGSGSGPRDITSTSVSLTGRAGAQQVLTQALAQQLGREPSPTEVTRFLKSLNTEERANPTVTHTHIGAGGAKQSSTTTQSDVNPSASAEAYAKTGPFQTERGKYQDSIYFDLLGSMMGG